MPTFQTIRAQSIKDVTFAKVGAAHLVFNWQVLIKDYFSDCKCISFRLHVDNNNNYKLVKLLHKTDWEGFSSHVNSSLVPVAQRWNHRVLDNEV